MVVSAALKSDLLVLIDKGVLVPGVIIDGMPEPMLVADVNPLG
jgi:hypothetical protein